MELILFRHAKSRWDRTGLDDHDRDLADRGERDASRMGALIAAKGLIPDLAFCSTATRARRTWELAAAAFPESPETVLLRELYLAPPDRMLALVRARAGSARRVLLVGHNPGLHELAVQLAATGEPDVLAQLADKFPTAGLARLVLAGKDWEELVTDGARLLRFWRPRDLS